MKIKPLNNNFVILAFASFMLVSVIFFYRGEIMQDNNFVILTFVSFMLVSVIFFYRGEIMQDLGTFRRTYLGPHLCEYTEKTFDTQMQVLFYFGQSNSSNTVRPSITEIPKNSLQYDWRTKKCFAYKEPLLGAGDFHSNSVTSLAVKYENDYKEPLLVVPFGVPGSSILEWSYGHLSSLFEMVLLDVKSLKPKKAPIMIFIQGEKDSASTEKEIDRLIKSRPLFNFHPKRTGINQDDYARALENLYLKSASIFPESKFGIVHATRCGTTKDEKIRAAQKLVASRHENAVIIGDLDLVPITKDFRFNGCRLTPKGAESLSEQLISELTQYSKRVR
jgi:hypothetical protein